MPPKVVTQKIPMATHEQPDMDYSTTCPKTGHVVPLPTGTPLEGHYTLFDDKGKQLHQGMLSDLIEAETAASPTDSEDA